MNGSAYMNDFEREMSAMDAFNAAFKHHFGPQREIALFTEEEAAAAFGCSVTTIQSFAAMGVLTPIRLEGNSWYSRKEIINKFANGGSHEKANGNGGVQTGPR